jgi:hypothetical protein
MCAHLSKPIKAQQLGLLHELVAARRRKDSSSTDASAQ